MSSFYLLGSFMLTDLVEKGESYLGVACGRDARAWLHFFGRFITYSLASALAQLAYYMPWMSYILLAWKNFKGKKGTA